MSVAIKKNSYLKFATLLEADGIAFWDTVDLPTIVAQPDDIRYTAVSTDRFDLLAYKFYGNPILKWVILAANDLEDDPADLNAGDVLTIPAPRYVLQVLFSKAPPLRRK